MKLCNSPAGSVLWVKRAQRCEAVGDQVHRRLRPAEHRLEHHEQDEKRIASPATGCSSTASSRAVSVSGAAYGRWIG